MSQSRLKIEVISLFPSMFNALKTEGVIAKALKNGLFHLDIWPLRDYGIGSYKRVDDRPFGGGAGMVLCYESLRSCLEDVFQTHGKLPVYYLSPQGKPFSYSVAESLSCSEHFVLLCGRYEGVDQRFIDRYVDAELSLGDFVLSGGELAAMCMIDACVRLVPGVLGNESSAQEDSFAVDALLKGPAYTRPECIDGQEVPKVLLSGNHAEIAEWRQRRSLEVTASKRPDLLKPVHERTLNQKLKKAP